MPPYANLSPRQLRSKLALVEREIELACPELIAEKKLLEGLIRKAEMTAGTEFKELKGYPAFSAALLKIGRWATVKEVQDTLVAGGYPNERKRLDTIRDLMNRHATEKVPTDKRIQRDGDVFGLSGWATR